MRNGNLMHVCRECGEEGTADVQLFILALNGDSRQLRGYWHPRCFKKVQRHIIVATRTWVLSDVKIGTQIGSEGKRIDLHQRTVTAAELAAELTGVMRVGGISALNAAVDALIRGGIDRKTCDHARDICMS